MSQFASYVICTSPRSGSTLLCNLLRATGVAGNPGSHFHDPSLDAWMGYYDLSFAASTPEHTVVRAIFEAAHAVGKMDTGLFGLRLQRHSFAFFTEKLALLHPGHPRVSDQLEAAFGRTGLIHLTRRDKVEQAVSYVKAQQTGLWHAAPDGTELERLSPPQEPVYDRAQIASALDMFTKYDQDWEHWFQSERLEPLRLTYEGLSADPGATLQDVLGHLGVGVAAAEGVTPGVAKLADQTSQDWVDRFRRSG